MLNDLDPRYLLSVLLRRFPVFLLTAVMIFAGFAAAAVLLPATYTAQARILVESQQIPTNMVQSTVGSAAAERLRVIQQRLTTRENMLDIANQYGVFRNRSDLSPSEMVSEMRRSTNFRLAQLGGGRGGGGALIFNVSFSAPEPGVTAQVVNEYVTRILEDNLQLRTSRAADTYQFFDQESQRLASEMTAIEAEIVEFKRANRATLPETLSYRSNSLNRIQQRQQLLDREIADLEERRRVLLDMQARPELLLEEDDRLTEAERSKRQLENQRRMRLALLSEEHPEIRSLDTRIAALERIIEAEAEEREASRPERSERQISERLARVNQELELTQTKLNQLRDELASLERQEAELDRSILETPNTEMALNALRRNYSNLQGQYSAAQNKLAVSATGEQLELKQQSERFEVIEQANVPESPDKPDRAMIVLMGIGGGAGAGLGLVFLLEMLNRAVRRPSDIIAAINAQPLAVIPYIYTDAELARRARVKWGLIVGSVLAVATALALAHFYYLPLDLLARKMLEVTRIDMVLELIRSRLNP